MNNNDNMARPNGPGSQGFAPQPATPSSPVGADPSRAVWRIGHFMGEQEEREAVVDWLRKTGDKKKHGSDWRTYYEAADAIEIGAHRDSDTHRMAETGTGSGRSLSSAGLNEASPNPSLETPHEE